MQNDLLNNGWKTRNAVGLMDAIGPLWARKQEGGWAYGLLTTKAHVNNAGMIHGGVLTTLADHVLSILAWEAMDRQACVTLQLDTHFIAGVKPGDFIEVRGEIASKTRSTLFLNAHLTVGDKKVAQATGIWKAVPTKKAG